MISLDLRALPRSRAAIVALLILTAWLLAAPSPIVGTADPASRVLQRLLGPLGGPVAATLRVRAAYARESGHFEESIRLQQFALDLDPTDTHSIVWLAGELAMQVPASGASSRDASECARAGIDVLRRARSLGNTDPELLDWQAFLWVTRAAPPGSEPTARRQALDAAIDASEEAAKTWVPASARASFLLEERGELLRQASAWNAAADDFARAAQHERLLAERAIEGAASRAAKLQALSEEARAKAR